MAIFNQVGQQTPCVLSMMTLSESLDEYVKEKGTYPPAATWQDELAPYYIKSSDKITEEFKDAPGPLKDLGNLADISAELSCNSKSSPSTYLSYNSDIAGKKPADIIERNTITFFETTTAGRNLAEKPVERKFADSPKMMGTPRGWYQMNIDGEMVVIDENGKVQDVDISTGR